MTAKQLNRREFLTRTAMASAGGYTLYRLSYPAVAWAQDAEYTVGAVAGPATVAGVVKYEGAVPDTIMREVTTDFAVAGRDPRPWEGLSLSGDGGMQAAVVVINGIAAGKDWAEEDPMAYTEGAYILERSGAFAWRGKKTALKLINKDPILHSWIATKDGGKPGKNLPTPAGFPPMKYKIKQPGLYELTCAPHPWERGWRMVVPHPYYALCDGNGAFEISDVPAGSYKATVWAEGINPTELELTVAAGSAAFTPVMTPANLTDALKA